MPIRIRRAWDAPAPDDGIRVLVDRIWPRGRSRAALAVDDWAREVAPSDARRRWFGHDPSRWDGFRDRYFRELDGVPEATRDLRRLARQGTLTLVYGARDDRHNNAVALRQYLGGHHHRRRARSCGTRSVRSLA